MDIYYLHQYNPESSAPVNSTDSRQIAYIQQFSVVQSCYKLNQNFVFLPFKKYLGGTLLKAPSTALLTMPPILLKISALYSSKNSRWFSLRKALTVSPTQINDNLIVY